jgi:dienelactone hydrolase
MPVSNESYRSSGQSVPIDVFRPAAGTHPAVLIIHGSSGLGAQFRPDIESFARALEDNGIAAALPHYFVAARMKADDDGLLLIDEHYETWKKACADALELIAGDARFDAARLGVLGFSLGAHYAVGLAMDPPAGTRVKGVVDFFGPTQRPPLAAHWATLPLIQIHHGKDDRRVSPSESTFLIEELDRVGKTLDRDYFVNWYAHEGHGFKEPALTTSRDATVKFMTTTL